MEDSDLSEQQTNRSEASSDRVASNAGRSSEVDTGASSQDEELQPKETNLVRTALSRLYTFFSRIMTGRASADSNDRSKPILLYSVDTPSHRSDPTDRIDLIGPVTWVFTKSHFSPDQPPSREQLLAMSDFRPSLEVVLGSEWTGSGLPDYPHCPHDFDTLSTEAQHEIVDMLHQNAVAEYKRLGAQQDHGRSDKQKALFDVAFQENYEAFKRAFPVTNDDDDILPGQGLNLDLSGTTWKLASAVPHEA